MAGKKRSVRKTKNITYCIDKSRNSKSWEEIEVYWDAVDLKDFTSSWEMCVFSKIDNWIL